MSGAVDVHVNKFKLRTYQTELWDAITSGKYKRAILVASRRSGKDILCWNLAIHQAIVRPCIVYYVLPTYKQAKQVIFENITNDSEQLLDFIPKELISNINQVEMKITFKNGSRLICLGGKSFNTSMIGTNPTAIVLSEYSRMSHDLYGYIRPILAANPNAWVIINTTPYGKNHFYHFYNQMKNYPEWKVLVQKASEIKHISEEKLKLEREQMDEGLYLQEYECDFERGVEGTYYGHLLERIRFNEQITEVPWDPGLLVHTAWDIGVNDHCAILFWQSTGDGGVIKIIDCYSNTGMGLDHYIDVVMKKPYRWGTHFGPHDLKVREFGNSAQTRFFTAHQLGFDFTVLEQNGFEDGIDNVRKNFNKLWIDERKCKPFVDALENYKKKWNEKMNAFEGRPPKHWANHYADALRYLCHGLDKIKSGMDVGEFNRLLNQKRYGTNNPLPLPFRQEPRYENIR